MFVLQIIFCVGLPRFISAFESLMFLDELQSHHTFHFARVSLISCPESVPGDIDLIKMFSMSFHKYVAVHRADDVLRPLSNEPQMFVLNIECPQSREVLQQAEELRLFGKPFQWLLLTDGDGFDAENGTENQTHDLQNWWFFLETLSLLPDSDVKVAAIMPNEKTTLTGIYKVQKGLLKEPLAEWTPENGLTVLNRLPVAIRRWNLQGAVLPSTMIIVHPDSINHLEDLVDTYLDRTTKVAYNIVRLYDDMFNTSIKFRIDTDWGRPVNGSWTGMTGDLEKNKIEFGGSPLFFREERMGFVEYYEEVFISGTSFIFLSPPLSSSRNIFLMPFNGTVWYCCLSVVVISCILLFTAVIFERSHYEMGKGDVTQQNSDVSFVEILLINIGAICLQGTAVQTKNPPGRILTLFVYLSYMFLYISYSGSIVAILQSSDTSIRTLSDFLNSRLDAGVEDVVYNRHYFRAAEDEVRKAIYTKKVAPKGQPPHFITLKEGIEKVRKGHYGFHTEVSSGYQIIQNTFTEEEKCSVQELKETFLKYSKIWLAMRKKCPYSELIKIGIKKCTETGIKNRFETRFDKGKPTCSSKAARFVSVGIIDCYYAFMLLIYGWVAAFLIFVMEISLFRFIKIYDKHRRVKKKSLPEIGFFN